MATLISTSGGSTSNSYVESLSEANTVADVFRYLPRMGVSTTAWDAASDDSKTLALIQATVNIDAMNFLGQPSSQSQALAFPRTGISESIDDTIPSVVKQAQVAEACSLLSAPDEIDVLKTKDVKSFQIGSKSVTFSGGSEPFDLSTAARMLLERSGMTAGSGGSGSVFLPRG